MQHLGRRQMQKPLALSEQLDLVSAIYRQLGPQICRATALPMLLAYFGLVAMQILVLPQLSFTNVRAGAGWQEQGTDIFVRILAGPIVGVPLVLLAMGYVQSVVGLITTQHLLGQTISPVRAQARTLERLKVLLGSVLAIMCMSSSIPIIGALLLVTGASVENQTSGEVASVLAMILLVASIVWVPGSLNNQALVPMISVCENLNVRETFARNKLLLSKFVINKVTVHGSGRELFGQVWAIFFLIAIITGVGFSSFVGMFSIAEESGKILGYGSAAVIIKAFLNMLPWFLALWCAITLWSVACAVVYFDRRMRIEGLDIELLAKEARYSANTADFLV